MTQRIRQLGLAIVLIVSFFAAAVLSGCEGSEAKKAVEDTVKEVTGAGLVEKGEKIKKQIQDLNAQDIERIQKDIEAGVYGKEE